MNCHQTRELLPVYLDNELGEPRHGRLEAHLHGCAACRRELEEARDFNEYLLSSSQLRVPPDFLPRVVARMRIETSASDQVKEAAAWAWARQHLSSWLFGLFRAPALGAIAVLLAVICGYQAGRMATPQFKRFAQPQQARTGDWLEIVPREFASAEPQGKTETASKDVAALGGQGGDK
jgi:anti-sigma factor RsiW